MRVIPIPCLSDNYAYLLVDEATGEAAVVDASEAKPVRRVIEREKARVTAILSTHHHYDHVGGNEALASALDAPVYAGAKDKGQVPGLTHPLSQGDTVRVGGAQARVIHIPGHTLGHIAYAFPGHVFTGDTLFFGGCGRLFEGTPAMMLESLVEKLGALPDDTRVYCGHEYTANNLEFALTVEPGNAQTRETLETVRAKRKAGEPSIPSTIGLEKAINPFLRAGSREIQASVRARNPEAADPVAIFAGVRAMKDSF
jgi:hydroxyacylglutathione hydrolase